MNINEIAKRAGVSRATVSRYLNNGYVSVEKRDLISRVIKETGYIPSRKAQQLRTGKTDLVAVVIPKINSQSVSRMVEGVTDTLALSGYQVILANTNNDPDTELRYLRLIAGRKHVDGVILIATVLTEEHQKLIDAFDLPFVAVGQQIPSCSCVYHDDYHAARDITCLALAKAKQPAYLGVFERDVAAGKERHRGFLDACTRMDFSPLPDAQQVVGFDADSGYFGAEKILDLVPDVDTIVCATDEIAFGALSCLSEYGRRIPEDVQVTGMGDSPTSRILRPSLTTVHLHYKTCGAEAARLLLAEIQSTGSRHQQLRMGYELFARNSIR